MSAQPIHQHEEQPIDPQIRARMLAACDSKPAPSLTLRYRLSRASRSIWPKGPRRR